MQLIYLFFECSCECSCAWQREFVHMMSLVQQNGSSLFLSGSPSQLWLQISLHLYQRTAVAAPSYIEEKTNHSLSVDLIWKQIDCSQIYQWRGGQQTKVSSTEECKALNDTANSFSCVDFNLFPLVNLHAFYQFSRRGKTEIDFYSVFNQPIVFTK